MFPWVDGFHWSVGHIIFLSVFFAVVLTILVHGRSRRLGARPRDFRTHRATEICWRQNFAELPEDGTSLPPRTCRQSPRPESATMPSIAVNAAQFPELCGVAAESSLAGMPVSTYSD